VYKSENGCVSWFPLLADQENILLYFKSIDINPEADMLYVATTGAGLFTVDLKGAALKQMEALRDKNIRAVAFYNSKKGPQILAGTMEHGIYSLESGADEWLSMNNGLTYRDVNSFVLAKNNELFAGTKKDVFRWNDSAGTWSSASEGIINRNITSMAYSPDDGTLYAGAGVYIEEKGLLARFFGDFPCLYKSIDNGETWEESERGIEENSLVYNLAVNRNNPDRIYAATSTGIYLSVNRGKKWKRLKQGLPKDLRAFDIEIVRASDDTDIVYAATSKGVFAAPDMKGAKWEKRSYGLPATNITGIVIPKG
jgi:photosystem II stability/assembly factor-like uncharacterized protein